MTKLANLVENMNSTNKLFMTRHNLNPEQTGGVYDFLGKCVIYFDALNPSDKSKHKVFKAVLAGIKNFQDGSFIWALGNKNLPEDFQNDTIKLKEYGNQKEIPEFVERCLIIDPVDILGVASISEIRAKRNFNDGFKSQVIFDDHRSLYSRFTSVELFAVITKLLNAKMSSSLPVAAMPPYMNAEVFIIDEEPLLNPNISEPTAQLLNYD